MKTSHAPVDSPTRFCDLVMKGGITSGVVYPLAVLELSKAFRFKNIGGTSAGAIAAAAAAAAELGRQRGQGSSFALLAELPRLLSAQMPGTGRTRLFGFFQPQKETTPLFHTLVAGLGGGSTASLRVTFAGLRQFWLNAAVGALPGILLVFFAAWSSGGVLSVLAALAGLLLAVIGAMAGVLFGMFAVARKLPENFFGLCTGMPGVAAREAEALTPWLTRYLNELAGLDPEGPPLTFGDLWGADNSQPNINLEMITTCLSHGRPYRLPFRDDDDVKDNRRFFYREEDLQRLFPEVVVHWMRAHRRAPSEREETARREAEFIAAGFLPMPEPRDLPVVVAVRMSLSFPVLLSAVPLYAVDYSRVRESDRRPERCWFSDGGISSNFPIHFFDAVLPRWPTFGIDLAEKHPDYDAGFYMPTRNASGTLVKWKRFDRGAGIGPLINFLSTIVMTSKDWADATQCRLPGFRDRIGQISLGELDGGLNLDMTEEQITRLCAYGEQAGREFVKRFATDNPECVLDWRNHRWVRLRAGLAAMEEWLLKLERGCAEPQHDDPPYPELINDPLPPSYPFDQTQRRIAGELLKQLRAAAALLNSAPPGSALRNDSPSPRPELRMRPRI